MGILDDLSRQASKVASTVSTGIDDTQAKRRLDQLLYDYGLLLFRQQTGKPLPGTEAEIERVWREIHETLARYPKLDPQQKSKNPPPPPAAAAPPSPPPAAPPGPPPSLAKPAPPASYGPPPAQPSSGGPPPPPPGYGPPPPPGP